MRILFGCMVKSFLAQFPVDQLSHTVMSNVDLRIMSMKLIPHSPGPRNWSLTIGFSLIQYLINCLIWVLGF